MGRRGAVAPLYQEKVLQVAENVGRMYPPLPSPTADMAGRSWVSAPTRVSPEVPPLFSGAAAGGLFATPRPGGGPVSLPAPAWDDRSGYSIGAV